MEVTRYHNKKEMSLSKKNIFGSLVLIGLALIIFLFQESFVVDGVNNYHIYLIISIISCVVFIFSSPYIFYFDTFKSKLHIDDEKFSFEDELNMFDLKINRSDIENIEVIGNKVILQLKNEKTYTFEVKNEEDLKHLSM